MKLVLLITMAGAIVSAQVSAVDSASLTVEQREAVQSWMRHEASRSAGTHLTKAVGATETVLEVQNTDAIAEGEAFKIGQAEMFLVIARTPTSYTVERGYLSTAKDHASGAQIEKVMYVTVKDALEALTLVEIDRLVRMGPTRKAIEQQIREKHAKQAVKQ